MYYKVHIQGEAIPGSTFADCAITALDRARKRFPMAAMVSVRNIDPARPSDIAAFVNPDRRRALA